MGNLWSSADKDKEESSQNQLAYGFEDELKETNSFAIVEEQKDEKPKLPCRKCFYRTKRHEIILDKAIEACENAVVEYKVSILNNEAAKTELMETRKSLKIATDSHHKSLREVGVKSILTRRQCKIATEEVKKAKQKAEFSQTRERRKEKAVLNLERVRNISQVKLDAVREKEKACTFRFTEKI